MTGNEARLLRLLGWVALGAAVAVFAFLQLERVRALDLDLRDYASRLERLGRAPVDEAAARRRIGELEHLLEGSAGQVKAGNQPRPLADFGHELRARLTREGLKPLRYEVVDVGGHEELQFALRCGTEAFFRFLRGIAAEEKGWSVPYLSVHEDREGLLADIVVRVSDGR